MIGRAGARWTGQDLEDCAFVQVGRLVLGDSCQHPAPSLSRCPRICIAKRTHPWKHATQANPNPYQPPPIVAEPELPTDRSPIIPLSQLSLPYNTMPAPDVICVQDLAAHILGAGPSAFGLAALPCPVEITLTIELDPAVVPNDADSMPGLGVNYSSVSKGVYAAVSGRSFANPAAILATAARVPLALEAVTAVDVKAVLPRALLHGVCAYERRFERGGVMGGLRGGFKGLGVNTIIGLHPHERAEKQRLEVDVAVSNVPDGWEHKAFADSAYKVSPPVPFEANSSSSSPARSVPSNPWPIRSRATCCRSRASPSARGYMSLSASRPRSPSRRRVSLSPAHVRTMLPGVACETCRRRQSRRAWPAALRRLRPHPLRRPPAPELSAPASPGSVSSSRSGATWATRSGTCGGRSASSSPAA